MSASPLLPLFPLQTVLFPGGLLRLRVFEARYVDLVARCLREHSVFGVNLIASGAEVGGPAEPHAVGVSARITSCDAAEPGVLEIVAFGERRFRVRATETGRDHLLLGTVDWLDEPPSLEVPAGFEAVVDLLRVIVKDAGEGRFAKPYAYEDVAWVGMRLAEVLPIPQLARQRLLELDDALSRLEIIRTFLEQRGLVSR